MLSREIKSVWGYARTARQRVTCDIERAGLPSKCYLCLTRFMHRPNHKARHEWHHKNGNPFDNRKPNFVALCHRCHSEVHGFALQTYLLVSWSRLGMHVGSGGMTYVTKGEKFFIKASLEQLHRKRPRRFMKLAAALRRWARELARATSLTKTEYRKYRDRLLVRDLREAIRVALPSERVVMHGLLGS
jgi:hypothetical protein